MKTDSYNMSDEGYTSLTFYNQYGNYSVNLNKDIHDIYELVEELIKPTLLAAGFSEPLVDTALGLDHEA